MSHPVDPTFRLNAPFRTDFGRNEHDTQGAVKRGREGGDHTEYGHADRAAAQTGSFAKAGHRLHTSTPAVAKQINTFEKEYGLTLSDRSRSGVQPPKPARSSSRTRRRSCANARRVYVVHNGAAPTASPPSALAFPSCAPAAASSTYGSATPASTPTSAWNWCRCPTTPKPSTTSSPTSARTSI